MSSKHPRPLAFTRTLLVCLRVRYTVRSALAVVSILLTALVTGLSGSARQEPRLLHESLIEQYRHGDADAAVIAVAKLPAREVGAVSAEVQTLPSDGRTFAAVMLHTEAALRGGDREANLKVARFAITRLPEGIATVSFVRSWRIVVASWLLALNIPEEADRVAQTADTHEETLLLQGAVAEAMAAAVASQGRSAFVNVERTRSKKRVELITQAEEKYRAALARNLNLAEAALRLGWMLAVEADYDAALDLLTRARAKAEDGFIAYMAALLTGSVHEQAGRIEAARECYQSAVREYPEAQTARIALAHLLERSGHEAEGRAQIGALYAGGHASDRDPWWVYPHAQFWQTNRRMSELREFVRRQR
jgi:tetratricopeptide (TPR) repeat protein